MKRVTVGEFLLLSRKIDELCANDEYIGKERVKTGKLLIENTKIQLASGEYDLRYFKMRGRIQIDLYAYFRRDFNLSSYKLDDVAGQFIGDEIKKIMISGSVTELYTQNITGLNVNDFIHIELSSFTTDYYKGGFKFRVLGLKQVVDGKTYNG